MRFYPQNFKGNYNANTIYTPQGLQNQGVVPPDTATNWVNGANDMINGSNRLVFAKGV